LHRIQRSYRYRNQKINITKYTKFLLKRKQDISKIYKKWKTLKTCCKKSIEKQHRNHFDKPKYDEIIIDK